MEITNVDQTRYCNKKACEAQTIHHVSLRVNKKSDLLQVELTCTNCGFVCIHSLDYDDVIDSIINSNWN